MASPSQSDYSGPLPSIDPNADPNGFIAPGNALIALDPSNPTAVQQPVGNAIDAMAGQEEEPLDDLAAQLAAGRRIRITSKEQWAAMSPHQKEVVRAAMATGGKMRAGDAVRIYQDSVKRARATQGQTVNFEDGTKVNMVNGMIVPPTKQPEPVKMEIKQAEDGTMVMIDPLTGRSFPAWNEASGEAVRGQAKLSATQEDNIKRLQMQSENIGARLNALTNFTEGDKVEYDNQTGNYAAAPWMGTKVKDLRTQLEKEKNDYDKRIEISLRPVSRSNAATSQPSKPTLSATPSPTPRPNPMPTPSQNITKAQYDALAPGSTFTWNGKTYPKK